MLTENPTEYSLSECRKQLDVVVNAVDKMDEVVHLLESIHYTTLDILPLTDVSALQDEANKSVAHMQSSSEELKVAALAAIDKHEDLCC